MSWMPSFELVCTTSHVLAGMLIVLCCEAFWTRWIGVAAVVSFVAFKEFIFDILIELDNYADGAIDALGYAGGVILALGLLGLRDYIKNPPVP